MKFQTLRNVLAAGTTLAIAALLSSCGGGGAGGNPTVGGAVFIAPQGDNITFYAGMPREITFGGGRPPYVLIGSDQGLLPLPTGPINGNSVTVVPNNPGVINSGISAGELPLRSVGVQVRDSTGILSPVTNIRVAQNFLTGYGVTFTPSNCPTTFTTGNNPVAQACSGGTTAVRFAATFNGALVGARQFRLEALRGNFALRNVATGQVSNAITVTSDHNGIVTAFIEVPVNVPTQLAVIRVQDVATGVYTDTVFTISNGPVTGTNLVTIPNQFTFKAALSTECGTGSADFLVFGGVPPYTATSLEPNLRVEPTVSNTEPGRFTFTAFNRNWCMDDATIVVTDSRGGRGQVTVDTVPGDTEPPAPAAFAVGPTALTLGCGQTGSVIAVGGTGNYFAVSTNPNLTPSVMGNVVSITRAPGPTNTPSAATSTASIGVSDGQTVISVSVTFPTTCT